ncbi:MAG: PKD domain-containing protein, partial [Bacteroidetes bacterium]|nr:PKD domain-containing protein [Bacteroidota bacterium]
MKRTITSITAGLFLFFSSLQAQTTCSDDRVAYVNSKNIPSTTGAYTLSIGAEEKASQAYHYSGPGKVGGARVYGDVLSLVGVKLKVSLYNVDANDRPTGSALSSTPITPFFAWSPAYFDVSFSPSVPINSNFALVVEIINSPGWGQNFELKYTGNGEGLGEDLASIAGTTTGHNWASAMDDFGKDGDFFIYPRMINFNTPKFEIATSCINVGVPVTFSNSTEMTTDRMFNIITQPGYSGTNFLYTWNFGDGSAVSHLANPSHTYATAGSYTISLTSTIDGWDLDCSKTFSKPISVGLSINATSIANVSCNGGNNGSVVAVGAGGATPYLYSINGDVYQSSTSFSGLTARGYTLYIKDNLGCIKTTSFTITQPSAIHFTSATSTNSSCGNADGGILVVSSGGIPPMQYQLNSGAFQSSGTFSSLSTGAYTVTAKDANGCTFSNIVLVNDAGGPAFSVVNSTNVSCYGGNDGTISLSSLGGTGAIQYSINGGTTFQPSGTFTNVTAGTYTEIVKDAAGCTDLQVVTISQPQELTLTASAVDLTCNGSSNGQINIINSSGGTGAISYSINGISYQSGTNFPGLAAGNYTVYARDVAGCVKTILVVVGQPTILTATVSVTNALCNNYQDGSITITANGGTPGYTYGIADDGEYQALSSF